MVCSGFYLIRIDAVEMLGTIVEELRRFVCTTLGNKHLACLRAEVKNHVIYLVYRHTGEQDFTKNVFCIVEYDGE